MGWTWVERFTRCILCCCRHGMYILGVIKKIVGKIDDTEYLEKLFDDLSDLHRRLGVEASGMDIFGKVFCKVFPSLVIQDLFCKLDRWSGDEADPVGEEEVEARDQGQLDDFLLLHCQGLLSFLSLCP